MIIDILLAVSLAIPSLSQPDAAPPLLVQAQTAPRAGRVVPYGPEAELRAISRLQLSPEALAAFQTEFATATYFGAFAISKEGGWGYTTGTNGLAAAREIAMQECLSVNARCLIHTELVPRGYVDPAPGEVTLSPEAAQNYTDATTNTPYAAMAVSADGAYSKVWGHASPAEAEAAALADCENNRIADPGLSAMPCVLLPRPGKR
jgi:hypothetical protein